MKIKFEITTAELQTIIAKHFGVDNIYSADVEVIISNLKNESLNNKEDLEDEKKYQEWQDQNAKSYDVNNYEDLITNINTFLNNYKKIDAIKKFRNFTKFSLDECKYAIENWPATREYYYKYGFFHPYNKVVS